jgi:hypothetical protein
MTYKRNQIEEAIARLSDPNCQHPSSDLRMRIRRLLELDRAAGRKVRSNDAEEANFAFFSDEAPGTGADVSFSEYEAFALVNALILMAHGWPASFAVSVMRRVRRDLEKEHRRILQQDPDKLFDEKAILERARPGALALTNTDPVFIALASKMPRDTDETQAVLVEKVLDQALPGDVACQRMMLDRVYPPPRAPPIQVNVPPIKTPQDVHSAIAAILTALGQGRLTPDETSALSSLIGRSIQVIELHRSGDEAAWWRRLNIDPLPIALRRRDTLVRRHRNSTILRAHPRVNAATADV